MQTVTTVQSAQAVAPTRPHFRTDIQGLRAIAVLSVVLFHAGVPFLRGGFIGVDVFFVLSGFLITGLMVREMNSTEKVSLVRFYARRARRLVPMATTVLLTTLCASFFLLTQSALERLSVAASAAATFWANWYFAIQSGDYFAADVAGSPVMHFWSLSVEEQFYVLWPLILIAVIALARRRRFNRRLRMTLTTTALLLVTGISLVLCLSAAGSDTSYFATQTRLWELGFGALLAIAGPVLTRLPRGFTFALGWLGIGLIGYAAVMFNSHTVFPGRAALVPVIGTCLVLAAGVSTVQSRGHISRFLSMQWMQYVGARSYNLYLWHWPALVLASAALTTPVAAAKLAESGHVASPAVAALALSVAGVLTVVSYRLIEQPLRTAPIMHRPSFGLPAAAFAIAVTVIVAMTLPSLTPTRAVAGTAEAQVLAQAQQAGAAASDSGDACSVEGNPLGNICATGDPNGSMRVAMIGDSHSANWVPAVSAIGKKQGWAINAYAMPRCWFASQTRYLPDDADEYLSGCPSWNRSVRAKLREGAPFDAIIISRFQRNVRFFASGSDSKSTDDRLREQIADAFTALSRFTKRIIILQDPLVAEFNVPDCIEQYGGDYSACEINKADGLSDENRLSDLELEAARDTPEAHVAFIPTIGLFCADTETMCPVVNRNGDLIFRDHDHLTTVAALEVVPQLTTLFRQRVPGLISR